MVASDDRAGNPSHFPTTWWSLLERAHGAIGLVAEAGGPDAAEADLDERAGAVAEAARAEFGRRYYIPARAYLGAIVARDPVLRRRLPHAADRLELLNSFFADVVLERDLVGRALEVRRHRRVSAGFFRNYLKASLRNYLSDWKRRRAAGGARRRDALGRPGVDPSTLQLADDEGVLEAERALDGAWMSRLLTEGLELAQARCHGKHALHWTLFAEHYLSEEPPSWEQSAREHGLVDGKAARSLAQLAVRRLREALLELAGEGCRGGEEEIADLLGTGRCQGVR